MKKVLCVATYGGFIADFECENIRLWKELGCEVHAAACFTDPDRNRKVKELDKLGVIRHNLQFSRTPYSIKNLKLINQLRKLIIEEKIDIIDTHNPVASIFSRLAANVSGGVRVLYTVHGFFFYKGAPFIQNLVYKPIEFIMAYITDYIIVTNLEDYEAVKKMPVRIKSFYVHGVGVDVDNIKKIVVNKFQKRAEFGIAEEAIIITSVGECINRKNHESALKAIAMIKRPNVYYVLVGDGVLYEQLKQTAVMLNISDKCIFTGYREDANEILKMSDIFLFPSFQEGLSVALMQAMAVGLPVVASKIRGNIDCIIDGKGGFTVGPTAIDDMADAIIRLVDNQELRTEFGKYNVKKVNEFSRQVVRKENESIFKEIVS